MKSKAVFYHAGCPVCITAEQTLASSLNPEKYEVEVVHLGEDASRIEEAKSFGVKSVPALLLNGSVFHINFGADIRELQ